MALAEDCLLSVPLCGPVIAVLATDVRIVSEQVEMYHPEGNLGSCSLGPASGDIGWSAIVLVDCRA